MPAEEELTFADRVKLSIFFFQLFGHDHLQLVLHLPGQNIPPSNPQRNSCAFSFKEPPKRLIVDFFKITPPKALRTGLRACSLSFTEGASCRAILAASWCPMTVG